MESPAKSRFSLFSQHITGSEMTPGKTRDQRDLCLVCVFLPLSPHILGPVILCLSLRNSPGYSFLASRHSTSYRKHPQAPPRRAVFLRGFLSHGCLSIPQSSSRPLGGLLPQRFNSNSSRPLLPTFLDSVQRNLLCADPVPTLRDGS